MMPSIAEILIPLIIFTGSAEGSKNLILFFLEGEADKITNHSSKKEDKQHENNQRRNFFIIKILLSKFFFIFGICMFFFMKDSLNLLVVFSVYLVLMTGYTAFHVYRYQKRHKSL
jgi:hypothetical protein